MTFGSQQHANEIANLHHESHVLGEWQVLDNNTDWELAGSGSYRYAYLHKPTNIVYKVEDQSWNAEDRKGMDNVTEAETAFALRNMVWCGVYIPRTSLFDTDLGPIIAMEYITGERHQWGAGRGHAAQRMELYVKGQLGDMHTGNYLVVGDYIVPIDLASSCRRADRRLISDIED